MTWPVGHNDTKYSTNHPDDHREEEWWIGKPWRRLALLTTRSFYKGETINVERDFTVTLGLRRLGLHVHLSFVRSQGYDYNEEPNQ